MPPEPILTVRDLHVSFLTAGRWQPAVNAVSFTIAAGETLAIVGESGSGKSVTALSVMRLLPRGTARMRGEVLLEGRDLAGLRELAMRRIRGAEIAMIFQEPMTSLNPIMRVGDQVAEALLCHSDISRMAARAEALRLLDRVRIPAATARAQDYPHLLSGGMRQRVMIAMALAGRPRLLIADEPTTALDVTIQAQILDLISELQAEDNTAILFITHDMGVVAETADRTLVMLNGAVVEDGTTQTVFAAPRAPYTRQLLAVVPRLGALRGHSQPQRFPAFEGTEDRAQRETFRPNTVRHDVPPVLEVRDLVARFDIAAPHMPGGVGRVHAVENISFTLQPGETLSLVGESGCGKSTTGRSIVRLIEPLGGSIKIGGTDILTKDKAGVRRLRRQAQMIFQDPFGSLNPRMSVGAAIAEPLVTHGLATAAAAREQAGALLETVGLRRELGQRLPHELSGGQRQRICIARALALRPKVIIADEAVSALDVSIKAQVINLLFDLQAEFGLAYLFISHDMAVVERISHRVAVMYLGEIVEIGPRAAIFETPQHPYTKRLLANVTLPDPARRQQRRPIEWGEVPSPIHPLGYLPPPRFYQEVSPGHLVLVRDEAGSAILSRAESFEDAIPA